MLTNEMYNFFVQKAVITAMKKKKAYTSINKRLLPVTVQVHIQWTKHLTKEINHMR